MLTIAIHVLKFVPHLLLDDLGDHHAAANAVLVIPLGAQSRVGGICSSRFLHLVIVSRADERRLGYDKYTTAQLKTQ